MKSYIVLRFISSFFVILQAIFNNIIMNETTQCIVCQASENDVPILDFKFKGKKYYICSQHIPVLIHKAQALETVIPGIQPSEEANK